MCVATSGARERRGREARSRRRARARSDRSLAKPSTPSATVMSESARSATELGARPGGSTAPQVAHPRGRAEAPRRTPAAHRSGELHRRPRARRSSATRSARARSSRVPRIPVLGRMQRDVNRSRREARTSTSIPPTRSVSVCAASSCQTVSGGAKAPITERWRSTLLLSAARPTFGNRDATSTQQGEIRLPKNLPRASIGPWCHHEVGIGVAASGAVAV